MNELSKRIDLLTPTNISQFRNVMVKLMAAEGVNTTELARRINLPQPTVHRLVVGKTEDPKLSTLISIAEYFSITLDQLLGNADLASEENLRSSQTISIPVISWENALHAESFMKDLKTSNWSDWFILDMKASAYTFGLRSKPSMEPRFSSGSILAVDPMEAPQDGNIAIVHYPNTHEATIREMILDGPKKLLRSITDENEVEEFSKNIKLIGTVIQARYTYKQKQ